MRKNKLLLLLALLMTAATGAWAQEPATTYTMKKLPVPDTWTGDMTVFSAAALPSDFAAVGDDVITTFPAPTATGNAVLIYGFSGGETKYVEYANGVQSATDSRDFLRDHIYGYVNIMGYEGVYYTAAAGTSATYSVKMKDGVKDADKWTISPNPAEEGQTVTLQYNGRLKVKGVTATSEAAAGKTDLLSGVFSVSSTKKVNFSKGNLQATYNGTDWTWAFAKNQWDYIGNAAGNTSVNGNGTVSASNVTVDLFGWVGASSTWTGAAQYGISNSTATDNTDGYGNVAREALKSDWGNTIGTGWFTLSSDEWQYLFNTRTTGGTVFGTEQARYAQATINTDGTSVKGMILFPDGVSIASTEVTTAGSVNATSAYATKCTTAQWAALAAKGCVFLPAAGNRNEASVYSAGSGGYYWSSSPNTSNVYYAYRVIFLSGNLSLTTQTGRYLGYSVRLVCEVTE